MNIIKLKSFMKLLKHKSLLLIVVTMMTFSLSNAFAQDSKAVMVGGAPMYPTKNIIENAVNSKDHTTLVAAVKAAGLLEALSGAGPFTVFAPTDEAFQKLPSGTVDNLVKPENKSTLTAILTYHVIPGKMDSKELRKKIKEGHGKVMFTTLQGEQLTFAEKGKKLWVIDSKGNKAEVTIADVYQSNGVIHVINTVLMP
jgi:uncharacterized surface protein with fasciclin (FAS1) repeats